MDYQILLLTPDFYNNYPSFIYPELEAKPSRAYNCLLLQSHYGFFICIPYRSNIKHKYAFFFKYSKRSKRCISGLDFTKIAIINDTKYLDNRQAFIDHDEMVETDNFIKIIAAKAEKYVDDYVLFMSGKNNMSKNTFLRKYKYSTLQYFHDELGISNITPMFSEKTSSNKKEYSR